MSISVIATRRRLVLFVDDEPVLRKNATAHLEALGMDVVAVGDGDAALETLRDRRPDIVCLDVDLPRISGYEVCEAIRSDPALEGLVVLMTCHRSLEARAYSYEAGANAYLGKPYTMDRLAKEVRRLLEPAPDDGAELSLKLA